VGLAPFRKFSAAFAELHTHGQLASCKLRIKGYETYRYGRAFRSSTVPYLVIVIELEVLVDESRTLPFPAEAWPLPGTVKYDFFCKFIL
jgi:hypothetical protein